MSDGRRNSSFMPHIVGREIAGLIMDTMGTCLLYFSTGCLNTRQHYTYNTLHGIYIHTRVLLSQYKTALHVQHPIRNLQALACARRTSIFTYSSSTNRGSHDVYPQFGVFSSFLFVFRDYLAQFELCSIFLRSFWSIEFLTFSLVFSFS